MISLRYVLLHPPVVNGILRDYGNGNLRAGSAVSVPVKDGAQNCRFPSRYRLSPFRSDKVHGKIGCRQSEVAECRPVLTPRAQQSEDGFEPSHRAANDVTRSGPAERMA
jgi:hypothetical protein